VPDSAGGTPAVIRAPLAETTVWRLRTAAARVPTRQDLIAGKHHVYVALLADVPGDSDLSLYVGMTGLTPDERYLNHLAGIKSGKGWVRRYGLGLLPQLVVRLNPMSEPNARVVEGELHARLEEAGFDVHGA